MVNNLLLVLVFNGLCTFDQFPLNEWFGTIGMFAGFWKYGTMVTNSSLTSEDCDKTVKSLCKALLVI